jgi:hypothetical protein
MDMEARRNRALHATGCNGSARQLDLHNAGTMSVVVRDDDGEMHHDSADTPKFELSSSWSRPELSGEAAIAFGTQDAAPVPQLDSTGESRATADSSDRGSLQWLRVFTPKVPMVGAEGVLEEQLAVPTQQPVSGVHYFRHTIPTFWRHPNPDTEVELAAHRAPAPLAPELPPDPWLQYRPETETERRRRLAEHALAYRLSI